MTKRPAVSSSQEHIEFLCRVDGFDGFLRFERGKRGKLRILVCDGFGDPIATLGKRKTAALVNWLAATQGVEPT